MNRLIAIFCLCWLCLVACTSPITPGTSSAPPTIPPAPDETARVTVRLRNQSDQDFERVRLTFPDRSEESIYIHSLLAGAVSEPYPMPQIFQSAQIDLKVGEKEYNLPAYDLAAETPITSGSYVYSLDLQNDQILLSFEPGTSDREGTIAPIMDALANAGATVQYEPSIVRDLLFDTVWGEPISSEELLQVNGERVKVFVFTDAATAEEAATAIQPGGTMIEHIRADGTVGREFHSIAAGQSPLWWRYDRFLVLLGDLNPPTPETADLVSTALGTDPLNASPDDGKIWLRVYNRSDKDFESVTINNVVYGALPRWQQSAYQVQAELYRYAAITVEADGDTYRFTPIDYMGETPFASGAYTYVLELATLSDGSNIVAIAYLEDGALLQDTTLLGKWEWQSSQQWESSDNVTNSTPAFDGEAPYLEFTDKEDPNDKTMLLATGFSGCNGFGGSYQINADHALMMNLAITEMACPSPIAESEQFLMNGLRQILYYQIEGDTLRMNTQGGVTLIFTRK